MSGRDSALQTSGVFTADIEVFEADIDAAIQRHRALRGKRPGLRTRAQALANSYA